MRNALVSISVNTIASLLTALVLHWITRPLSDLSIQPICSGLMKPDTHLGENARQIEVSDDQTTPLLYS